MGLKVKTATMTAVVDGVEQAVKILVVDEAVDGGITFAFDGSTATIGGLAGTNITYSGKTATIGGI